MKHAWVKQGMNTLNSGLGASALLPGILVCVVMGLPPQVTRMTYPAFTNSDQQ